MAFKGRALIMIGALSNKLDRAALVGAPIKARPLIYTVSDLKALNAIPEVV